MIERTVDNSQMGIPIVNRVVDEADFIGNGMDVSVFQPVGCVEGA